MSGFAAVIARGREPVAPVPELVLQRLTGRGQATRVHQDGTAWIAAVRQVWELSGEGGVALHGELVAVADASLFYLPDLRRRLGAAGIELVPGATPAETILACYRAWGLRCAEALEGDFAFLVWDGAAGRVMCARDFTGRKPLFFADLDRGLVVASTAGAVLAHPECPGELDLASVAAAAAGLFASHTETAYAAVRSLPPGHTLVWSANALRLLRHWVPPAIESRPFRRGADLDEGAEQLRALLGAAVAERMDPARPTAVWMSGGWDSTAVFGAGMAAVASGSAPETGIRPVSISYPPGDPGREDELIHMVGDHWKADIHWLRIQDIPLLDEPEQRAAQRDDPFGHLYEMWNRALARGAREVGARVAFDGVGGDQLFQLSYVNLSDLLRRGRLPTLQREWRRKQLRGRRSFWNWVVQPALPPAIRRMVAAIARPEIARYYLERPVPSWMDRGFLAGHGVLERESRNTPSHRGMSAVAYETHWYLTHPYAGRILSTVSTFAEEEGVQLRSPLYDRRIVEFAASRPWSERSWGVETKRLLRHAARAWLPEPFLAPRPRRTGLTSGYFEGSFRNECYEFTIRILEAPLLADLGMVDAVTLRKSVQQYRRSGNEFLGVNLFLTLQTELWLRARDGLTGAV